MQLCCSKTQFDSPPALRTAARNSKGQKDTPTLPVQPQASPRACRDSYPAPQRAPVDTQNKVLVIMDYQKFRKQAYRGTGCQRGSSPRLTVSIQNHSLQHRAFAFRSCPALFPWSGDLHASNAPALRKWVVGQFGFYRITIASASDYHVPIFAQKNRGQNAFSREMAVFFSGNNHRILSNFSIVVAVEFLRRAVLGSVDRFQAGNSVREKSGTDGKLMVCRELDDSKGLPLN